MASNHPYSTRSATLTEEELQHQIAEHARRIEELQATTATSQSGTFRAYSASSAGTRTNSSRPPPGLPHRAATVASSGSSSGRGGAVATGERRTSDSNGGGGGGGDGGGGDGGGNDGASDSSLSATTGGHVGRPYREFERHHREPDPWSAHGHRFAPPSRTTPSLSRANGYSTPKSLFALNSIPPPLDFDACYDGSANEVKDHTVYLSLLEEACSRLDFLNDQETGENIKTFLKHKFDLADGSGATSHEDNEWTIDGLTSSDSSPPPELYRDFISAMPREQAETVVQLDAMLGRLFSTLVTGALPRRALADVRSRGGTVLYTRLLARMHEIALPSKIPIYTSLMTQVIHALSNKGDYRQEDGGRAIQDLVIRLTASGATLDDFFVVALLRKMEVENPILAAEMTIEVNAGLNNERAKMGSAEFVEMAAIRRARLNRGGSGAGANMFMAAAQDQSAAPDQIVNGRRVCGRCGKLNHGRDTCYQKKNCNGVVLTDVAPAQPPAKIAAIQEQKEVTTLLTEELSQFKASGANKDSSSRYSQLIGNVHRSVSADQIQSQAATLLHTCRSTSFSALATEAWLLIATGVVDVLVNVNNSTRSHKPDPCLDSGASIHGMPSAEGVTDIDYTDRIELRGVNGKGGSLGAGIGTIDVITESGKVVPFVLPNGRTHIIPAAPRPIVSLGRLLDNGFTVTPTVDALISPDGPRFPITWHNFIATLPQSPPLEAIMYTNTKRSFMLARTMYMHSICSHTQNVGFIKATLEYADHYFNNQKILPSHILSEVPCDICRETKINKTQLRKHGRPTVLLGTNTVIDHDVHLRPFTTPQLTCDDLLESDGTVIDKCYVAETPGKLSDFDITVEEANYCITLLSEKESITPARLKDLRPGELIVFDEKPYPVTVVGGDNVMEAVFVDVATGLVISVSHKHKKSVGLCVQRVFSHLGIHHKPHRCVLLMDGDPSNKNAEDMAFQFGVDVAYFPSDMQSMSQAELTIHKLADESRALLSASGLDGKYLMHAFKIAIFQDNRRVIRQNQPPAITMWPTIGSKTAPEDTTKAVVGSRYMVPFGSILAVRRTRSKKFQSFGNVGQIIRLTDVGQLVFLKNVDVSSRGISVVFLGYSGINPKDKRCLTINNNQHEAIITSRSVRLIQLLPHMMDTGAVLSDETVIDASTTADVNVDNTDVSSPMVSAPSFWSELAAQKAKARDAAAARSAIPSFWTRSAVTADDIDDHMDDVPAIGSDPGTSDTMDSSVAASIPPPPSMDAADDLESDFDDNSDIPPTPTSTPPPLDDRADVDDVFLLTYSENTTPNLSCDDAAFVESVLHTDASVSDRIRASEILADHIDSTPRTIQVDIFIADAVGTNDGDIPFSRIRNTAQEEEFRAAFDKEHASLEENGFYEVPFDDPDYQRCLRAAKPGRVLFAKKRADSDGHQRKKCRAVEQGNRTKSPDGTNTYSPVTSMQELFAVVFRPNRNKPTPLGVRLFSKVDVSTAYLQSLGHPEGTPKSYHKFWDPFRRRWIVRFERTHLYGSDLAAKTWYKTVRAQILAQGFVQGYSKGSPAGSLKDEHLRYPAANCPCLFFKPDTDTVVLVSWTILGSMVTACTMKNSTLRFRSVLRPLPLNGSLLSRQWISMV